MNTTTSRETAVTDDGFEAGKPWGALAPRGAARLLLGACHALPGSSRVWYRLGKLLRGPLRKGQPRPYDVSLRGLRLRLMNRGNFCETTALFTPKFYDVAELDWLCGRLADGGTFLDVGANVGLYSLVVAGRLGARARVHAVEPDPKLARRMRFNAAENGLEIHLHPVALSDYEGEGRLALSTVQSGQNAVVDGETQSPSLAVQVTTLPSLCRAAGIDAITALKIDVEGHEDRILSHFFQVAGQDLWPRAILIEYVHDAANLTGRLMSDYGYREAGRTFRNLMLVRDPA